MSMWSRGAAISGCSPQRADELGVGLARAFGGLVGDEVGDAEQQLLQLGVERLLLVVRGRDHGLQLAGALDQRGPLLGARALHRLGHALGSPRGPRRRAGSPRCARRAASPARRRPGRSPGGPACGRRRWRDRAGRGGRASHQGIGAGVERVSRPLIPLTGGGGPGRDRRRMGGSSSREVFAVSTAESAAAPVVPSVRLRHVRRPAARRHHRRQPRPHGRRPARPRGAGRRAQRAALDLRAAARGRRRGGARPAGRGPREGRPGRDLGAELRRVDARAVRHREDRRDPGQHQPGLPHARAGVRAQPVRDPRCWSRRRASRRPTTRR